MWGDPERAATFDGNDPLALLLYQVASPAHLPWNDTRWNELLHGYDVWVHLDDVPTDDHDNGNGSSDSDAANNTATSSSNQIISAVCQSMAKHATTSSNLATLSLHVTRMVRDLSRDLETTSSSSSASSRNDNKNNDDKDNEKPPSAAPAAAETEIIEQQRQSAGDGHSTNRNRPTSQLQQPDVADFSKRISLVAKARATAGALRLLRLLCHPVIVQSCQQGPASSSSSSSPSSSVATLREAFTYHTRGDLPSDQPAGYPLMHSLLDLVVVTGRNKSSALVATPEVYDVTVFAIQLLLVMCSTQLYQPFHSSFTNSLQHDNYILDEIFLHGSGDEISSIDGDRTMEDNNNNNNSNHTQNYNLNLLWASDRSVVSQTSSSSRQKASKRLQKKTQANVKKRIWTPRDIVKTCLEWQINRPLAPPRSLAYMYFIVAQNAVTLSPSSQGSGGGEKPGPDGMYESHMVVQATAPEETDIAQGGGGTGSGNDRNGDPDNLLVVGHQSSVRRRPSSGGSLILDATKGVLTISGSIFLLPFRLMSLVIGVLKHSSTSKKTGKQISQEAMMKKFSAASDSSRTRDVLWLTDSALADLSCSLLLLLSNNNRNCDEPATSEIREGRKSEKVKKKTRKKQNPFRAELYGLTDNRWDGEITSDMPDLPSFDVGNNASFSMPDVGSAVEDLRRHSSVVGDALSFNFELLFDAFGRTLHTELGALSLYTLVQSSPAFAESLAVRSDVDTLVLPLLRTLYFSSSSSTYLARDYASKGKKSNDADSIDIRSCPFRSQSQLYVIIIILLIFSQERTFGRDVFQRTIVPSVLFYKERKLKNINLGSVILLTLLRLLLFNLNRIKDAFLLSNCCAVLINLSHAISDLHDYASMRLASVTVTVMKKHAKLAVADSGSKQGRSKSDNPSNENGDPRDELPSPLSMHAEAAHTLLELVKYGVSASALEGNLHLVYALVYHQIDLIKLCKNTSLYKSRETERIKAVVMKASSLIQMEGARSAPKALKVLEDNVEELRAASAAADEYTKSPSKRSKRHSALTTMEDEFLPFTYQEEADPEVFFLPYVWDIIVCVVTSSTMEWRKNDIKVFPLLDEVKVDIGNSNNDQATDAIPEKGFSEEVDGIV